MGKPLETPDFSPWPRLASLLERCRGLGGARTGVVYPCSAESLRAACVAHQAGVIQAVLYAPRALIEKLAISNDLDLDGIDIVDGPEDARACATQAVTDCRAALLADRTPAPGSSGGLAPRLVALMKGSLHTDEVLSAVITRRSGMLTARRLSHVFVFDLPKYHKLLGLADAVVNIAPNLKTKKSIVQNAVDVLRLIGVEHPKVAILAAVEGHHPGIAATVDALGLIEMARTGAITGATLDGAFGFDNAVSHEAARIKGIRSEVAGDADLLIAPDLNAGNILYKSFVYMAGAECAGVVLGAAVPIILTSRADSVQTRLASCALASLMAHSSWE